MISLFATKDVAHFQDEYPWKGIQPTEVPEGVRVSPRVLDLLGFITGSLGISAWVCERKINQYKRVGHGFMDICYWIGDENIIKDPAALSPRILWFYLSDEGPTKAFKMWDLPDGTQAEEEVIVTSDLDVQTLIIWIMHPDFS